jgi:PAS domain S-box-containing protein
MGMFIHPRLPERILSMTPPLPPDEADRLRMLRRDDLLDAAPEPGYDDLTWLAAHLCQTPGALIALLDQDRLWFKSKIGDLESPSLDELVFCSQTLLQNGVLVVEDTLKDSRFCSDPAVNGGPRTRFYAGTRLVTPEGHALGTLCVTDSVPRSLEPIQMKALEVLGRQVVALIESRHSTNLHRASHQELQALFDLMPAMICLKDTHNRILRVNQRLADSFGISVSALEGKPTSEVYPQGADKFYADDLEVIQSGKPKMGLVETVLDRGKEITIQTDRIPVTDPEGKVTGIMIKVEDISRQKLEESEMLWKTAFLEAQIHASPDGILVVDPTGKKILQNQRLIEIFQIPPHIAADPDDELQICWVKDQINDPQAFVEKVAHIYAHPHQVTQDEIALKDGTVLDRHSSPVIGSDGTLYGRIWLFHDITTLKTLEINQRESKRFLRSTLDALTSHIAILDENGIIIHINAAWNTFAGENHFEGTHHGLGDNYLQICQTAAGRFSKEAQAVADGIRTVMTGEQEEFHLEYRCHSPGEKRWFMLSATRFAGDGPIRVVVDHENITERRKSEEKYRSLFENMVEGYADFRLLYENGKPHDLVYRVVNNAFGHLTGLKNVIGKKVSEVIPRIHETNPELLETYARVAQTGKPEQFETHLIPLHLWLSVSVYSFEKEHCIAVFHNITENKRIEARLRRLMDSNAQGMIIWNQQGDVLEANDAFLNLIGYSREDMEAGRINWISLTPPEFTHLDLQALELMRTTGASPPYEKEYIHKNGSRVPILLGAAVFEDNRNEGICFFVDLSPRKKIESQLMKSQKMETVSKLAGGIAHEFNSILTAIIGQSDLLLRDLPERNPLLVNAAEISKAAGRAAVLTRQLLAYSRKQLLHPEVLDLNQLLSGMGDMLSHIVGNGMDIHMVTAAELPSVRVDAGQMEQVIMNIVLNAQDAMPNGGKLTLETSRVTIGPENAELYPEMKPGDFVLLAITDTGSGMSKETQARIFEPFFTTKETGEGTGLGLSTCDGIIKQSGGHLNVYSEWGLGTTFKIYLPQVGAPLPSRPPAPAAPLSLPHGSETILLVEDDPALREMAATLLKRLGYTVLSAAHGVEALSLSKQRRIGHIDLLFTDLVMPHMSGRELADRMQSLSPHTRVLFTSAYTDRSILHQGVLSEGVAILQKPFSPSALAQKIREVLDAPAIQASNP